MQQETRVVDSREFLASQLKRPITLAKGYERLRVEPDGSVSQLYTSRTHRLAFGRESISVFKVQAGILVPQRHRDLRVRISPSSVELRSGETPDAQTLTMLGLGSAGYSRTITLSNGGDASIRLRVAALHDPTSMCFRKERDPPGEIGVNAFNRGDHIVMDDVGDTTGVRALGFSPRPSAIFMTKDKQRALDLAGSVELLDPIAGMSGAILVLTQWEVDLHPGARTDLRIMALYHPSSLEAVLADLTAASGPAREPARADPVFRSSSPSLNFAYGWAKSSLDAIEGEEDDLERQSLGVGFQALRPDAYEREFEAERERQGRSGMLPNSRSRLDGPLETSLFLINACSYLTSRSDKKLSRKWYPPLRKAGRGLQALVREGLVSTGPGSPGGWRRRLGSGFPTGTTSEVNLMVSRALTDLARVAFAVGKGTDSAGFRETSVKIVTALNGSLRDAESGALALNLDPSGRLHKEATADQAVSLSYNPLDHNLASSMVHRLLDPDFETGYGPRTVPSSNALYYSPTYGDGQLGGYWTRAALSHALLAYSSGYPSIGGLQLEKICRLVCSDSEKVGSVPGEFPYWLDPEKRVVGSSGSDPVAASRFIEVLLLGELGLDAVGRSIRPPASSKLQWLMFHGLDIGGTGSFFLGRSSKQSFSASSYRTPGPDDSRRFVSSERLALPHPLECVLFWDDASMLVCVGNTGTSDSSAKVSVPVGSRSLSRSLFVDLEEFNPEAPAWRRVDRLRLQERVEFTAEVRAGSWKWYRVAQITS